MNIATELTPFLLLATLGLLGWSLFRASKRGKAGVILWLQGLMLFLPWIVFLGFLTAGVYVSLAGFILLLVVFTGLYIILGRQARKVATQDFQARQSEDPSETEASSSPSSNSASADLGTWSNISTAVSSQDLDTIKTIFSIDSFFITETIPYGEGVIFKGNLRMDPDSALDTLSNRLNAVVGDRYWLYLVEDSQEKPAVVILPDEVVNQRSTATIVWLAAGLFGLSLASTLVVGANLFNIQLLDNLSQWPTALPFTLGIMATLVVHDLGHRWLAKGYGVRLSPAFAVPSLGIGTLGTLNRIESPVPHRKALFDIALAGPVLGGVLSLIFLLIGFWLSGDQGQLILPVAIFRNSILVGVLARFLLADQFQSGFVAIHSWVVVGWIGLAITALGLLPAGQLDGGRMVQAIFGRKTAGRTTLVSLIILGIAALSNVIALYWALLILFIAREPERPPLNEITELDSTREVIGLIALLIVVLILLPVVPVLAQGLGFPTLI